MKPARRLPSRPPALARSALEGARRSWRQGLVGCLLATALAASAREAAPAVADPALEARLVRITSELRCLVCQNQTIADSDASLAVDLRREARSLIAQGKSDAEVIDYMTARYGDFVLYRPPLRGTTLLLWFGPALMLAGGAAVLVVVLRRRSRMAADAFDADDEPADPPGTADAALASPDAGASGRA